MDVKVVSLSFPQSSYFRTHSWKLAAGVIFLIFTASVRDITPLLETASSSESEIHTSPDHTKDLVGLRRTLAKYYACNEVK